MIFLLTRDNLCAIFDLPNEWGVKFKMKKSLWEISGYKLETLFIEADSFCDAIKIAREKNDGYCCGRPIIIRNSNKENEPNE